MELIGQQFDVPPNTTLEPTEAPPSRSASLLAPLVWQGRANRARRSFRSAGSKVHWSDRGPAESLLDPPHIATYQTTITPTRSILRHT